MPLNIGQAVVLLRISYLQQPELNLIVVLRHVLLHFNGCFRIDNETNKLPMLAYHNYPSDAQKIRYLQSCIKHLAFEVVPKKTLVPTS